MKAFISFISAVLLVGAFLYPLFFIGIGRPVLWLLVAGMTGSGIGSIYLLVKYRKNL